MNIDEAESWAWAYMASEQILQEADRRGSSNAVSTQVLLMMAYKAGAIDAKKLSKSAD